MSCLVDEVTSLNLKINVMILLKVPSFLPGVCEMMVSVLDLLFRTAGDVPLTPVFALSL